MILKKGGAFFCDAWYYHVCQEMDRKDEKYERILFDDLKSNWQFINRGFEVVINFCPFCGKELRSINPGKVKKDEEGSSMVDFGEDKMDNTQESMECSIKCMFCAQDVTVHCVPEEREITSEECLHCQTKIKFDLPS